VSTSPWDLTAAVERILAFRRERDWEKFHRPKELAAAVAVEAAELQEHFLWKSDEAWADLDGDAERKTKIAEEVADVVILSLLFAHDAGLDLARVVDAKIEANAARYPVEKSRGVARRDGTW
jgi:NTP pyrophosphatase (non-canonical NTP hydrolase)